MHISYFYDISLPSPYAAAIQILHTARALCEQGAAVTLYTNRITSPAPETCLAYYGLTPHPQLRIVPLFGHRWSFSNLQRRLRKTLAKVPPGEPHVIMSRGEPGIALFARLRRTERQPEQHYVYEAHRLCFTEVSAGRGSALSWRGLGRGARAAVRERERAAVEQADGLVCLTNGVRAALEREFRVTCPTLILPSGVALPDSVADGRTRDIDILYAGKLEQRKGVHDLIAAMRWLPDHRLWIVGGTEPRIAELSRLAAAVGVEQQVVFTGFVAPRDIGDFYARARVGVCPLPLGESVISEEFTSPLKVLEMMARGVPIVGTDLPALRELLVHGQTALLVEPSNPAALATGIRRLLDDRCLAARLAQDARARSAALSWQNRAARLLSFLRTLE